MLSNTDGIKLHYTFEPVQLALVRESSSLKDYNRHQFVETEQLFSAPMILEALTVSILSIYHYTVPV
jgi:hypothetical protein